MLQSWIMVEKRPLEVDDACPSDCSEEARESKRAKNEKRFPSPTKSDSSATHQIPGFTGLNNCTINFNIYNK